MLKPGNVDCKQTIQKHQRKTEISNYVFINCISFVITYNLGVKHVITKERNCNGM